MNKTEKKIVLLSLIVIAVSAFALFRHFSAPAPQETVTPPAETAAPSEKPVLVSEHYSWSTSDYKQNKDINADYVGTLRFESGLIAEPVVQGESNDTYLRTDWKSGEYALGGTCFMDFRIAYQADGDVPEDHNLIIYGHYMYPEYDPERIQYFTPLHVLRDKANYEANKYIDLLLEDEVRRYEVASVYLCPLLFEAEVNDYVYTYEDQQYFLENYDPEYLQVYKNAIRRSVNDPSLNVDQEGTGYDAEFTGVDFTCEDPILTLQTCVLNRPDLRLIVVAKEISREKLSDVFQ